MAFLTVDDLVAFAVIDAAKAQGMIDDATALALLAAPCLATNPTALTVAQQAGVKAVLRTAVLRWNETGTGALQSQTAGPFGQTIDTRPDRKGMFWPSEIAQLQSICASGTSYTISLAGPDPVAGSLVDFWNDPSNQYLWWQ